MAKDIKDFSSMCYTEEEYKESNKIISNTIATISDIVKKRLIYKLANGIVVDTKDIDVETLETLRLLIFHYC